MLNRFSVQQGFRLIQAKRPVILSRSSTFDEAVRAFKSGGVIAYPTETFYGLCVDPFNIEAVERLFRLKGRPGNNPVSVIIKDVPMLSAIASEVPPAALGLIKRFWPGPLTIVFKARPSVPPELTGYTGKIGVRASSNPVAARLSSVLDSPITATSANPTGKRPAVAPEEVIEYFNGGIEVLIDGGVLPGKTGSTVVDATSGMVVVVREGVISSEELAGPR